MTPTTYPAAFRPIVDAPPDVAAIFSRWCAEGMPWQLEHKIADALQSYRGVWLLTLHHVIWLAKVSDRMDDVIAVMPRSSPLRRKGERR